VSERIDPTASNNPNVYYQGKYWNDLPAVREHLNSRATGVPTSNWIDYLKSVRPNGFDTVLVLNCGNGWVERELLSTGLARYAVGIDISEELLEQARRAASLEGLNADYFGMNINHGNIPNGSYDLVLNHAAGHHIAYLDRVLRQIAHVVDPEGLFVSWDYTGPHRNQYGARAWEKVVEVNSQLPKDLQADLQYPHLPTMLIDDPSEAIHSELFLKVKNRYFDSIYEKRIGGAIAYPLLTFNQNIFGAETEYSSKYVTTILQEDANDTDLNPEDNLFSFVIARVRDLKSIPQSLLNQWTTEEENRESEAQTTGGKYYGPAVIGALYERIEEARVQLIANESRLADQEVALQELREVMLVAERTLARCEDDLALAKHTLRMQLDRPFLASYRANWLTHTSPDQSAESQNSKQDVSEFENLLSEHRFAFDKLVLDCRRVNEEKNAILNSRFWKYGQPIRKVLAILRRAN
jgi:SAM-dependent methyltransferase